MGNRLRMFKYPELERLMKSNGCVLDSVTGSHHFWVRWIGGRSVTVNIALRSGKDVPRSAIKALRKAWHLEAEDGVSDYKFEKGQWPPAVGQPPQG
jgi:predicted RNA binding protein YcfA (HicA-like mRNA interferase family)